MKGQPNRLVAGANHIFSGAAIDRSHPLHFTLNGLGISGFAGDTILSAVLASGIDTVGLHLGSPLALSTRCAPPIVLAGDHQSLPMDRTPAFDGAHFLTVQHPHRSALSGLLDLLRPSRSLGLDLDARDALRQPWLTLKGQAEPKSDVIVVGGGVAGMSAALAAAKAGKRVTLLEASPSLGGNARLFGTQEGEETPEHIIARLAEKIASTDAIKVYLRAKVFAVRSGLVRAHLVDVSQPSPIGRVIDYPAASIVLATGVIERLPIFSGNRLPGIIGTLEAFDLAYQFGVWPGRTALFATVGNSTYRLAMAATDAGVKVDRIEDTRVHPESRFIAFSRAYGISQATGVTIGSVAQAPKSALTITPELSIGDLHGAQAAISLDRLVISGGWQPDLSLWNIAGGDCYWDGDRGALRHGTGPAGIALAGSVAGYATRQACIASGKDAANALLGRQREPVEDKGIDPLYETPDAATPVATPSSARAPSYLDGGHTTMQRPDVAPPRTRWRQAKTEHRQALADIPHSLGIADIAACVQLGLFPAESAGYVARERIAMIPLGDNSVPELTPPPSVATLPPHLRGRHGPDGILWLIAAIEPRILEPGALLHGNSDDVNPHTAVGVVVRPVEGGAIALLDSSRANMGAAVVHEENRAVPVRFIAPYTDGMNLAAALGGSARTP